uniref:Conserved plasma membrane protein n=1 Tax=Steinernema glaseri TaxID=37863 RepID=A0A1I8AMI8_9BILA
MDLTSNTKKWRIEEVPSFYYFCIYILPGIVAFAGSYAYLSYMTYDDTSRPCDTNAYLDKAFSFHERDLSQFNYKLRKWTRGLDEIFGATSRDTASRKLNDVIKNAEALQKKLSGGENYEDLKDSALLQVHLAQKRDKSSDEAMSAIERYLKAVNIDRTFVLQKFLVNLIAHPRKASEAILNKTLAQFDFKVAELMKQTHTEYHEPIDTFWGDLKQNSTPGILKSCLPVDAGAEIIREEYKTMIDLRVAECVPIGEAKWEFDWWLLETISFIAWVVLLCLMTPITIRCFE